MIRVFIKNGLKICEWERKKKVVICIEVNQLEYHVSLRYAFVSYFSSQSFSRLVFMFAYMLAQYIYSILGLNIHNNSNDLLL